jgi:hypothetical protein
VFIAGVLPAYSAIVFQIEQNKKRDEVSNVLKLKIDQFKSLIEQEEKEKTILNKFNEIFPAGVYQSALISDFEKFALQNNLSLNGVSFSKVQREVPLSKQFKVRKNVDYSFVSINVQGSRRGVLDMIKDLENSVRIYNVVDVDIARRRELDEEGRLVGSDFDATINVEFYWTN